MNRVTSHGSRCAAYGVSRRDPKQRPGCEFLRAGGAEDEGLDLGGGVGGEFGGGGTLAGDIGAGSSDALDKLALSGKGWQRDWSPANLVRVDCPQPRRGFGRAEKVASASSALNHVMAKSATRREASGRTLIRWFPSSWRAMTIRLHSPRKGSCVAAMRLAELPGPSLTERLFFGRSRFRTSSHESPPSCK